jgi:hypothetical protein
MEKETSEENQIFSERCGEWESIQLDAEMHDNGHQVGPVL